MSRYFTQCGSNPNVEGSFYLSGPQDADQISQEIQVLLDKPGIHTIVVLYNHGLGERLDVIQKIKE